MEGTIAFAGRGAGRRAGAALLALFVLAFANSSTASNRDDARAAKQQSASVVMKPSSKVPSLSAIDGGGTAAALDSPSPRNAARTTSSVSSTRASAPVVPVSEPTAEETLLLDLVNVERKARGLNPLAWDGVLGRLARLHGEDMRKVGRSSHNSSKDGASYSTRLARTSYRTSAAAENVAYNRDVVKAHRALMDSPGHRRNILDPGLTALGTAVITDFKDDWVYVVEDFATPMTHISDEEAEEKIRESLARARSRRSRLPEDKALSSRLDRMLEDMIASGSVRQAVPGGAGPGWALAFTSLDPTSAPASAIERAGKADGYALAVSFRKTPRYPFGAYWAIVYLKGEY
ncbi:MAG: CAP domain-containing protein [Candidatus Binatia bacterium]